MVISSQTFHTGIELEPGDTLEGRRYDLVVDERPEELYDEFLEDYGFDEETVLEDATEFIDEEIEHTYDLAAEEGLDPEEVDRERRESQGRISRIDLSDVWGEEYMGVRAGTCRERAATLHLLLDELGIESEYHSGYKDEDQNDGHSWVQTDSRTVLDPSADEYVFDKGRTDLQTDRVVVRSDSTKDAFGQILS